MLALSQHVFAIILTCLSSVLSGLGHVGLVVYDCSARALTSFEFQSLLHALLVVIACLSLISHMISVCIE